MQNPPSSKLNTFAADVLNGLSSTPKFLSSKYFYDDEGSRLFQEIMELPEYYLTSAEHEIFSEQSGDIYDAFVKSGDSLELIELGAGDGMKTAVLIEHFIKREAQFVYSPIDISQEALNSLSERFGARFPRLTVNAHAGDYFHVLRSLESGGRRRKILLFLGSNIGNFSRENSLDFFGRLRSVMSENDLLFIGFDLQKDPRVIANAYDDSHGITAQFNLNLLRRINGELGANFDLGHFSHYAIYDPLTTAARSFLVSRQDQLVDIEVLNRSFKFHQWETIFMEISQKYSVEMIDDLARESGFEVARNFFDSRKYFCDSLWRPRQK